MVLRDMNIKPDTLVYLGPKQGSAFFWIGRWRDVPEQYGDKAVVETYPRQFGGYHGTVLLLEGNCKEFFNGKEPPSYWFWWECDKSVPKKEAPMRGGPDKFEALLVAMAREEARAYRNELLKAIDKRKKAMSKTEVRELISFVRRSMRASLVFLPHTSVGRYIIQRIEDDAMTRALCDPKEWSRMDYDDRAEQEEKTHKKLLRDRARQQEKRKVYATIRGRSVKH